MERVKEAIDRARASRAAVLGDSPVLRPGKPVTAPVNSGEPAPQQVVYSETRSARLDEDTLHAHRVIAGFRHDDRAEVYRQLRSRILPKMRANGWQTLAITSPNENAGKSLTAVNLAISMAQEMNQTVLLVDLDLRSPSIHEIMGFAAEKGLADCILEETPINEVLVNPQYPRLVVLPGRALETYSSELLTSPRMQAIMKEIIERYRSRMIIFDLPPLLRNDDALVFTPLADATLFLVEDGVSTEPDIKRCLHLLEGSNLLGTVLNKARY